MEITELAQSATKSSQLESALLQQYEDLGRRAKQHRQREEILQRLADQAVNQAAVDERLRNELAEALGLACQLRIEHLNRELRGQRLQEIAVEVLAARTGVLRD